MLQSFKERLNRLSSEDAISFHADVRKRVGKRATALLENRLKQIIVLMPKLLKYAHKNLQLKNCRTETKKLSGFLLTYIYHPEDFLPESKGLFSYLDDAYFTASFYEILQKDIWTFKGKIPEEEEKLVERIKTLKRSVQTVIPKEVEKIDALIKDIINGRKETFTQIFYAN